jgi:hypothetical protein
MAYAQGGRDGQTLAMQTSTPPLAAPTRPRRPVVPRMPSLRNTANRSLQGRSPTHRDRLIGRALQESLLVLVSRRPGRRRRRPLQARPSSWVTTRRVAAIYRGARASSLNQASSRMRWRAAAMVLCPRRGRWQSSVTGGAGRYLRRVDARVEGCS